MTVRRLLPLLLALVACAGEQPSRVLVLGLDGLDPQVVDLLMSEGRLPNFARLRREGAYGRLKSDEPLLSPILWTTIATGRPPHEHGITHFVAQDAAGQRLPVTSRLRRVKALWNIASEAGRRVAVVGWWATWPPEAVDGAVVSDHAAYHFLFEDGFADSAPDEAKTHPPGLAAEIAPLLVRPEELTAADLAPYVDVDPGELARPFDFADDLAHFRWALAAARSHQQIGLELWRRERPDLALVYVEGVDSTSHLFGHLFRAADLAGELAEQQRRYGRAVEEMYLFADRLVGAYLEAMDRRTTLIVLSDHGFRLGALHDDPSHTRDLRRVSERFHRKEGILYLYGHGVKPRARIDRPGLLDVTPTALALLGLPAAADMPGRVLAEALKLNEPPPRFASYEGGPDSPAASGGAPDVAATDTTIEQARLEHLRSLGYLGGGAGPAADPATAPSGVTAEVPATAAAPEGRRNLAAIEFGAGRYEAAAALYRQLLDEDPEDPSLHTSLAGSLGVLGRYPEALEHLERALELEPLSVEAYHNRAVILERQGRLEAAVADYRTAVRYAPDYEPSRHALERLTGSAAVSAPRTPAERQAATLAEQASQAARRGDYAAALVLLEQAESLAPDYPLLYQYRANVAYLTGDRDAAIAALERALELEPGNALFRRNLESLRRPAPPR